MDNDFDFSSLNKLSYINISNNSFTNVNNIIDISESPWITVSASNLILTEEDFLKIEDTANKDKNWLIFGATFNLTMDIDANNSISLEDKYYVRKLLMQQLTFGLVLENGSVDNKVESIYVTNPDNKKVSFKTYNMANHYGQIDFNISY